MNRNKKSFPVTLALSSLLVAAVTVFSAQAATSPGYVYDTSGKVVRNSSGNCVQTTDWNKNNATKECHPELFPEPKKIAAYEPAPAPKVMVFSGAALFAFDKAELTPAGEQKIREYREQVRADMSAAKAVKITGHTDNVGKDDYNQQLSLRRAEAVRNYLIGIGSDASKLEAAGMGANNPIADNSTPEGRAQNRRVEVEVVGYGK